MTKQTEDKLAKINFQEQVSEARVRQLVQEEEELSSRDEEINRIRLVTMHYIEQMEAARDAGDEMTRRKWRNEIIVLNLRLVTQVLKKYGSFSPDKFQNGCVGLLKAADTFNSAKEVPFANYACFCIEIEIRLAFKRVNRAFESKKQGYLQSLDAEVNQHSDDRDISGHDLVEDPWAEQEFDAFINEAEVDTLFYDIIIPCIEEYGTRAKDIDMKLWRELTIQYFIELSMEHSQRQRLTFSEMAKQLGTATQNIRTRHKKVIALIRSRLNLHGYHLDTTYGRARIVKEETPEERAMKAKEKRRAVDTIRGTTR